MFNIKENFHSTSKIMICSCKMSFLCNKMWVHFSLCTLYLWKKYLKIVQKQLLYFRELKSVLFESQFGFQAGKGTNQTKHPMFKEMYTCWFLMGLFRNTHWQLNVRFGTRDLSTVRINIFQREYLEFRLVRIFLSYRVYFVMFIRCASILTRLKLLVL